MKKYLKYSLLALLALSTLTSCQYKKMRQMKKVVKSENVRVNVMTVELDNVAGKHSYVAQAVSDKSNTLTAPYPGTLTDIYVKEGQSVKAGDPIAHIYSETVISAQSMADADLTQARDAYQRLMQVKEDGSVSKLKIAEVQASLAKAEASKKAADKAVDDCTVKAPFDGVITEIFSDKNVHVGFVSPIARIEDNNDILLAFSVPEGEIAVMRVGDRTEITIPAIGRRVWSGRVTSKGVNADPISHSYLCKVRPDSNIPGLMLGMVAKLQISGRNKGGKIVIPADMVRMDNAGHYVWTVDSLNTVQKNYITTGEFSGKGVIVSKGLDSGDRIITNGVSKVSTGMTVDIVE